MEDYTNKRIERDRSVELIRPSAFNDKKMSLQELKNEYTKAISYIDTLKSDKNNLIETIKLVSNRKPESSGLVSSTSASQLKGAGISQTEKKIVQLEQENRELKKALAEYRNPRGQLDNEKKVVVLEQENLELRKTVELKTDQIMALQKEVFAKKDQGEFERLEKNNRHLKSQVEFLNQDIERATKKIQETEEENSRLRASSNSFSVGGDSNQIIIKYINYILNTVNTFQPSNPMRTCFEERFTNALEVHRIINTKDYLSLLIKSLKYISDILIIGDTKPTEAKPLSIRNPNIQESELSSLLTKQNIQPFVQKRKSVGINRPNTPLGRSSGSGTLNTSIATNCQTPLGASVQTPVQDKRTSATAVKKHGRTLSQEISCLNNTESHIIYNQPIRHAKNLSLVPESNLNGGESTSILEGRRGSQTSRNEDKIAVGEIQPESAVSPKVRYGSIERERRSKSGTFKSMPQNTPLDTSLADKEKFINEKEDQLRKLDQDLQGKRERLRNLSRELDRRENINKDKEREKDRDGDSFSSSFMANGERKPGHKRVNTDSCISIRNIETEQDESFGVTKNIKEDDKQLIRLKPVLKTSSYNREREYNYEQEARATPSPYLKNEDSMVKSGFTSEYTNPYSTPKDQNIDFNKNYQHLESSNRGFSADRKSPLRRHGSDIRVGLRSEITSDTTTLKEEQTTNEYERPRRVAKEEDYSQKYLDDDMYQPKILPRPQPRDKLEDLSAGNTTISNAFSRNKTQGTLKTGSLLGDFRPSQVTFEMGDNTEEDLLERKLSTRNLGNMRSPSNSNLRPRGANYASFQVAFGRTEAKDRISPSPQEKRPKSPSIIDVRSKKRVEHVDQTYDVIRGEDAKSKQG